jgi:tetratricopeptide (TPR) repeat protein
MEQSAVDQVQETIKLLIDDYATGNHHDGLSTTIDNTPSSTTSRNIPIPVLSFQIPYTQVVNPIDNYHLLARHSDISSIISYRSLKTSPSERLNDRQTNNYQNIRQKQNEYWSKLKYDLAKEQYSRQKHSSAMKNLNDAIELHPDNLDAYYLRGLVHIELNHMQKAMSDLQHILSLKADHLEAAIKLRSLNSLAGINASSSSNSSSKENAKLVLKKTVIPPTNEPEPGYALVDPVKPSISYQHLINKLSESIQATSSSSATTMTSSAGILAVDKTHSKDCSKYDKSSTYSSDDSSDYSRKHEKRKRHEDISDSNSKPGDDNISQRKKQKKEKRKHKKEKKKKHHKHDHS